MSGKEIFKKYMSQRNFSGDEGDAYAQQLQSMAEIPGFFELLEQAESQGKHLIFRDEIESDEPTISDIVMV